MILIEPQDVRAYYQIASTRFVDHICQSVYAKLFAKCSRCLGEQLVELLCPMDATSEFSNYARHELQVYSANLSIIELDQISEWMTEDPQRLRQRKELFCEQKKLFAAQ